MIFLVTHTDSHADMHTQKAGIDSTLNRSSTRDPSLQPPDQLELPIHETTAIYIITGTHLT